MGFEANIDKLFEAQSHIYKHMYHYMESMSLKCVVQLGIPDIIHQHKHHVTLSDLASQLHISSTKTNSLERVMRILVHSGFFNTSTKLDAEESEEGYVLTPSSALLLKDSYPTSLSSLVLTMLNPEFVTPCFSLSEWLRKDELEVTAFQTYHGKNLWEYGKENDDFMKSLKGMVASDSEFSVPIAKDHKEIFEGISSLVDMGGGAGTLAQTISELYPCIQYTVLDLPQVVTNCPETKNLKFVEDSMFQYLPCADAILIKSVLRNWSDEACVKILKRCKETIRNSNKGKLIIIEMVINDKKDENELGDTKVLMDMEMMVLNGGKERDEAEWKKLFCEAGFSHYKTTATSGLNSIIQVYP